MINIKQIKYTCSIFYRLDLSTSLNLSVFSVVIDTSVDAQNVKQAYVKNGHTLPMSAGFSGGAVVRGGRSPSNQGKLHLESDFRSNPTWVPQTDERTGALGSRATGLHEDTRRGGGVGARAHGDGDWKPNVVWQGQIHGQMEEGRRGGRLHPEGDQKRPGLQKVPSEDGRRTRAAEVDWKPTLPRHASAEEGRTRRGESQLIYSLPPENFHLKRSLLNFDFIVKSNIISVFAQCDCHSSASTPVLTDIAKLL